MRSALGGQHTAAHQQQPWPVAEAILRRELSELEAEWAAERALLHEQLLRKDEMLWQLAGSGGGPAPLAMPSASPASSPHPSRSRAARGVGGVGGSVGGVGASALSIATSKGCLRMTSKWMHCNNPRPPDCPGW